MKTLAFIFLIYLPILGHTEEGLRALSCKHSYGFNFSIQFDRPIPYLGTSQSNGSTVASANMDFIVFAAELSARIVTPYGEGWLHLTPSTESDSMLPWSKKIKYGGSYSASIYIIHGPGDLNWFQSMEPFECEELYKTSY